MSVAESLTPVAGPAVAEEREAGLWECLKGDFRHFCELKKERDPRSLGAALDTLLQPGYWSVFWFRWSHLFYRLHLRPISRLIYVINMIVFGCDYWPGTVAAPGLVVPHPVGTGFVAWRIGRRCQLYGLARIGGGGFEGGRDGLPILGDDVKIYDSAKVFGPVTVGDGARVGAGCTVFKDVPPGGVVVPVPSRVIRVREAYRERSED